MKAAEMFQMNYSTAKTLHRLYRHSQIDLDFDSEDSEVTPVRNTALMKRCGYIDIPTDSSSTPKPVSGECHDNAEWNKEVKLEEPSFYHPIAAAPFASTI